MEMEKSYIASIIYALVSPRAPYHHALGAFSGSDCRVLAAVWALSAINSKRTPMKLNEN
jgi:hypothetical protein